MKNRGLLSRIPRFSVGLRLATISAGVVVLILSLSLPFLPQELIDGSTLWIPFTGILVFFTVYLISTRLLKERLNTLHQLVRSIAKKAFNEEYPPPGEHHDELDLLHTQALRARITIEREIKRLNKIEDYRKEFIGDISHELKTPIFAIQGFLETLLDGALEDPEVNRQFLTKAMKNANRLSYLTKDLMEISRLETGELKADVQPVRFHEILDDVLEHLAYKAQKEEVELLSDIPEELVVMADRAQLKQLLVNLIENGIKYNRPGGFVRISSEPLGKSSHRVLFTIEDNGIGMDARDIPRITERFFRIDKSRSRERGGTGLGLSIVKHIIESLGEDLKIESAPNEGSRFRFTLSRPSM
ncbi:MAG: sensor histidine kinase [Bacteroidota bacterium]